MHTVLLFCTAWTWVCVPNHDIFSYHSSSLQVFFNILSAIPCTSAFLCFWPINSQAQFPPLDNNPPNALLHSRSILCWFSCTNGAKLLHSLFLFSVFLFFWSWHCLLFLKSLLFLNPQCDWLTHQILIILFYSVDLLPMITVSFNVSISDHYQDFLNTRK